MFLQLGLVDLQAQAVFKREQIKRNKMLWEKQDITQSKIFGLEDKKLIMAEDKVLYYHNKQLIILISFVQL